MTKPAIWHIYSIYPPFRTCAKQKIKCTADVDPNLQSVKSAQSRFSTTTVLKGLEVFEEKPWNIWNILKNNTSEIKLETTRERSESSCLNSCETTFQIFSGKHSLAITNEQKQTKSRHFLGTAKSTVADSKEHHPEKPEHA